MCLSATPDIWCGVHLQLTILGTNFGTSAPYTDDKAPVLLLQMQFAIQASFMYIIKAQ